MRPLRLSLVSFRSYARAIVDLSHHSLVVISGDTGAGKTSILDGVCFALYGRTPELAGPRELLSLGATHGEVELEFSTSAGSRRWRVTRRFGPQAPEPNHVLEELDDAGEVIDRVTGHAPVNDRVVALIGMSFQTFTSAVLLAQGRFAQFLQSQPKDRDGILRQLFGVTGLEAVRTAAISARDSHAATATALEGERHRLGSFSMAARNEAARNLRAAAGRQAQLAALQPLMDLASRERMRISEATATLHQIRSASVDLGTPDRWDAALSAHRDATERLAFVRDRRAEAQHTADDAVEARDRLQERHGGSASELAALRGLAERLATMRVTVPGVRERLAARRQEVSRRRVEVEGLRTQVADLRDTRDGVRATREAMTRLLAARAATAAAEQEVTDARTARDRAHEAARHATDDASLADEGLDALRRAHLATSLRADLAPGDPCPVCEQTVHVVPPRPADDFEDIAVDVASLHERAGALTTALTEQEAELRAALRHRDTAQEREAEVLATLRALDGEIDPADPDFDDTLDARLREAEEVHDRTGSRLDQLNAWIEQETGSLTEANRRLLHDEEEIATLEERLGERVEGEDLVAAIDAAFRDLEGIEQAVVDASSLVTQYTGEVIGAESVLRQIEQTQIGPLRQSLAVVATRLGLDAPATDASPQELIEQADEYQRQAEWAAQDAETRIADAQAQAEEIDARVARYAANLGVDPGSDFGASLRAAHSEYQRASERLAEAERSAVEARRLETAAAAARRGEELAAVLAQDLQANRFPRFLLGRFHERLARGATQRLLALSNGAYTFAGTDPDPLAVIDHRRGHRARSAATLSGGERFLASLSLALAMSDIASGTEGRLECLFLDEGFSTLDADSLELAITGVERMADDGLLVVVITHLPGVGERLGSAIYVRKDPGGASRVIDLSAPDRQRSDLVPGT